MTAICRPDLPHCCGSPDEHASDACSIPAETAATVLEEVRSENIPADDAAIRAAGFKLLRETGRPVTEQDLIVATGAPAGHVTEILASMRARGRAEFDDRDRVIGIAGLTLTPGRHELTIDGTTRWTWCALDAVGILGALQATGAVTSTDPHTGDIIEIAFTDGRPDGEAHIFILGGFTAGNVRENWCPQVNFFASERAAEEWVAARRLAGDVVPVADISEDAAALWQRVAEPHVEPDAPGVG